MTELETIFEFCRDHHVSEHIPDMEVRLDTANSFSFRVGQLLNEAIEDYEKSHANEISKLENREDLTETIRKAKLLSAMSEKKALVGKLKNMNRTLRSIQMTLLQAIRTRRDELGRR